MDWQARPIGGVSGGKVWTGHQGHGGFEGPHRGIAPGRGARNKVGVTRMGILHLDGSRGEGGGQILRTALTLSLLTGRPFEIGKIRANRDKPGLRPQHLAAVRAAAKLGGAEVSGASVGSTKLRFKPGRVDAGDMTIDIGTAGATALVLQTLHLPLALRAESGVRIVLEGGTFNESAPSFPFLARTWVPHLARMGLTVALSAPSMGFYPLGGGRLDAWIEPGTPRPLVLDRRGPLVAVRGEAGTCRLGQGIAERMRDRALEALLDRGIAAEIEVVDWRGGGPGAALSLTADHGGTAATFVGLGRRGKPAEAVADSAVAELLDHLDVPGAAVDPHSADQLLLPLALAEGRSVYSVSEVTEHLRTNLDTLSAFLDRPTSILNPDDDHPAPRVVVG